MSPAFDQRDCPKCGAVAVADFVDIGVGMQQSGPFGCEFCGWREENPNNLFELSDEDDFQHFEGMLEDRSRES